MINYIIEGGEVLEGERIEHSWYFKVAVVRFIFIVACTGIIIIIFNSWGFVEVSAKYYYNCLDKN